jgi:hypothetical protein
MAINTEDRSMTRLARFDQMPVTNANPWVACYTNLSIFNNGLYAILLLDRRVVNWDLITGNILHIFTIPDDPLLTTNRRIFPLLPKCYKICRKISQPNGKVKFVILQTAAAPPRTFEQALEVSEVIVLNTWHELSHVQTQDVLDFGLCLGHFVVLFKRNPKEVCAAVMTLDADKTTRRLKILKLIEERKAVKRCKICPSYIMIQFEGGKRAFLDFTK